MRKYKYLIPMVLTIGITACQANPDREVVVGKNKEDFQNAIVQTDGEPKSSSVVHYQDSYLGSDGKVSFEVEADVNYFSGQTPLLRVKPHEITPEEVQRWAEVLFEGAAPYDPEIELSKAQISQKILEIRAILADESGLWENAGSQEDFDDQKQYWEEELAYYESIYSSAPEQEVKKSPDWSFHPFSYYNPDIHNGDTSEEDNTIANWAELNVCADLEGEMVTLMAANNFAEDFTVSSLFLDSPETLYEKESLSQTQEEAVITANQVLEKAGLEDWVLYSAKEISGSGGSAYYALKYVRSYQDANMIPLPQPSCINSKDTYSPNCYFESLEIKVSGGKVRGVDWMQPMDIVKVENSNIKVLTLDEVMDRCRDLMQSKYTSNSTRFTWESEKAYNDGKYLIQINEITCGLARVKVPDTEYEFYMVPAIFIYGIINNNTAKAGGLYNMKSPLLVINAVDGSNIDTFEGY